MYSIQPFIKERIPANKKHEAFFTPHQFHPGIISGTPFSELPLQSFGGEESETFERGEPFNTGYFHLPGAA
ncbi:MAG: hypothetical protein JST47_10260 [Bacteroidetes bacterium]|nr:hypothetical protein [Bacteroidota bacterium]MBS1972990.1 hypothetical protein [Bacteroidota bacterium]